MFVPDPRRGQFAPCKEIGTAPHGVEVTVCFWCHWRVALSPRNGLLPITNFIRSCACRRSRLLNGEDMTDEQGFHAASGPAPGGGSMG